MAMWSYSPSFDLDIKIEENEIEIKSEDDQELKHIVKTEIDVEFESYKQEQNEMVNNDDIEFKIEETEQESLEHQHVSDEFDVQEEPKIHTDDTPDSENNILMPTQRTWQCRVCNFKCNNKSDLREHITRTHRDLSNFNLFKCDICRYTTKYLHKLVYHRPRHETPPEPPPKVTVEPKKNPRIETRKCDLCHFTSTDENGLGEHVTATHKDPSNLNMFKCSSCSYVTEYFHKLKLHKACDGSPKMHHCDKCNYKTKYKLSLQQHMTKHISSINDQYSCEKCTFESTSRRVMLKHLLRHEENCYQCTVCDYQTRYKGQLKLHVVKHKKLEEVEGYKCDMCKFRTKWKTSFNKHVLKHAKDSA